MDILGAIGAINALLLALLLGKKKSKTVNDKVLIAWILNFSLYFGYYFLFEHYMNSLSSIWLLVLGASLLSHPVFLFIYSISISKKNFVFNRKVASNFLVVIIWMISLIPFLLMTTEEQKNMVYDKQFISYEMFLPMMIQLCVELFFFIRTLIVLVQHQSKIEQEFSYHLKINLSWLKLLTYMYIVILISNVVGYTLVSSRILNIKVMDDLLMVVRMLLFFYMVYHGFKQKLVYNTEDFISSPKTKNPEISMPKPNNSESSQEMQSEYTETVERLKKIMHDDKLFLKQDLSLGETANKLGIHAHQLSKLLKVQLNKNFFEFVNEYRVDEFKRLAINPVNKHISLLGLAMDAGFNSKATFNRFFKKSTGLTPSEFLDSYKL